MLYIPVGLIVKKTHFLVWPRNVNRAGRLTKDHVENSHIGRHYDYTTSDFFLAVPQCLRQGPWVLSQDGEGGQSLQPRTDNNTTHSQVFLNLLRKYWLHIRNYPEQTWINLQVDNILLFEVSCLAGEVTMWLLVQYIYHVYDVYRTAGECQRSHPLTTGSDAIQGFYQHINMIK